MAISAFSAGAKTDLQTVRCYLCATDFAMEVPLYDQRRRDHAGFWCPNGHEQHFAGKGPDQIRIEQLTRERDAARRDADVQRSNREWAEQRAKGANIAAGMAKAAKARLEHRVRCGVCPHCRRTFKQLAAHMKCKHPEQR